MQFKFEIYQSIYIYIYILNIKWAIYDIGLYGRKKKCHPLTCLIKSNFNVGLVKKRIIYEKIEIPSKIKKQ